MTAEVEQGLVSVVMPVYNREATVAAALASVLSQSYRDLEFLVVDDGSTDATPSVVQRFATHDERVRFIELPANEGRSAARNHALEAARGEFVTFIDSDDLFAPRRLERLVAAARRFRGDDVFIDDNMQFALRGDEVVLRNRSVYPGGVLPAGLGPVWVEGYLRWSAASKLFLRRSLVEFLAIRFPTELAQAEDDVVLLVALFGGRARRLIRVPESLYWCRRPCEGRRESARLLDQGRKALALAQQRAASVDLDLLAPRLVAAMERNCDHGDSTRRFDLRRLTRDRVVFAWCYVWARLLDAPRRPAMARAVAAALAIEEPEQR